MPPPEELLISLRQNIPPLHLKRLFLVLLAVALETAGMLALDPQDFDLLRRFLILSGFGIALSFAVLNLHFWPMRILALGLVLNLVAMLANGGLMPVTPAHAVRAGFGDAVSRLDLGDAVPRSKDVLKEREDTRLAFITDVIVVPDAFPGRVVASPGDIIVLLALLCGVLSVSIGPRLRVLGGPGGSGHALAGARAADP